MLVDRPPKGTPMIFISQDDEPCSLEVIRKPTDHKAANDANWKWNGNWVMMDITVRQIWNCYNRCIWGFLWHKIFVCMNCETYIALEYAHKPAWPTDFERSKIHQPYLEKLQFSRSKIGAFLGNFSHFPSKSSKNASILLPLNCNFSRLGWCISDFSKPVGQVGFWAYSKAK